VLIAFAIVRPVADVLMFDITPSAHRTTANGIAGAIAGFLVVAVALGGAALYGSYGPLPFWLAAAFAALVLLLVRLWIKEPASLTSAKELAGEAFNLKGILLFFKRLPKENARSLLFLLLSNFMAYVALAQMQAFLTSYGVFELGMEMSAAAMLVAIPAITYMVVAVPAGMLARKTGRKMTQYIGILGFAVGALVIWFIPTSTGLMAGLAICGIMWPIANVNHVIMVVDSAPVESLMGSYTGIRQISVTLGFIVGPVLGGSLVEAFGNDYRLIWPVMVVFLVFAALFMLPVTKGEARSEAGE
jgi:MFS family permease